MIIGFGTKNCWKKNIGNYGTPTNSWDSLEVEESIFSQWEHCHKLGTILRAIRKLMCRYLQVYGWSMLVAISGLWCASWVSVGHGFVILMNHALIIVWWPFPVSKERARQWWKTMGSLTARMLRRTVCGNESLFAAIATNDVLTKW